MKNEVIERYKWKVQENPENELARFSLGKAYFDAEQFLEAKIHLEKAFEIKSDWMVVQILIGRCEAALGHRLAAKAAYERAKQLAIAQNHLEPQAEIDEFMRELGY